MIIIAALIMPSFGYAETKRYEASFSDVFDTYSKIIVYADDKTTAQNAMQAAYDELKICHKNYDIYNDYEGVNNIKTINDNAGIAPVAVDARIIDLLLYSRDIYGLTGGRVNTAMGSVLRLWHEKRDEGLDAPENASLPDAEMLKSASEHTDFSNVIIDGQTSTVYLADAAMSLDVGAIAKGYAVERAAEALAENGISSALLSIGGNVRSIGVRGDGFPWQVSVQNPDLQASEQSLMTVGLTDGSLVSSGGYQRFYTVDGKNYHHIIDPDSLFPAESFDGVSIITHDSALADALSTSIFVMTLEEGRKLIDSLENTEALWVLKTGEIVTTDGFAKQN